MAPSMLTPNYSILKKPRSQRKRPRMGEGFRQKAEPDPESEKRFIAEQRRRAAELCEKIGRELGELALEHFNKTRKGLAYELTCDHKHITTIKVGGKSFAHINFVGKPKGAAEDEARLFFAEMQIRTPEPPRVICVRLLGRKGVVTGSQGCKTCSNGGARKDCEIIQHPVDGGFTKGVRLPGSRIRRY